MITVTVICPPDMAGCRKTKLFIVLGGHVCAIQGVKDGIGAYTFNFQTYATFNLISCFLCNCMLSILLDCRMPT